MYLAYWRLKSLKSLDNELILKLRLMDGLMNFREDLYLVIQMRFPLCSSITFYLGFPPIFSEISNYVVVTKFHATRIILGLVLKYPK